MAEARTNRCTMRDPRSGLTLVEILIAMAILAMGMFGILSLFPVAITNISTSVNRSKGAAIARDVIASLRRGEVGIRGYHQAYLQNRFGHPGMGQFWVNDQRVPGPGSLQFYGSWPEYIWTLQQVAGIPVGKGAPQSAGGPPIPSFRIGETGYIPSQAPPDVFYVFHDREPFGEREPFPELPGYDNDGDDVPDNAPGAEAWTDYVPDPDDSAYGWTAVFLPLTDIWTTEDKSLYRVQVAVWRNYGLKYDGPHDGAADGINNDPWQDQDIDETEPAPEPLMATFLGQSVIDIPALNYDGDNCDNDMDDPVNPDEPDEAAVVAFPPGQTLSETSPGDWIRHDQHGIWYRVKELRQVQIRDKDWNVVTRPGAILTGPFRHPWIERNQTPMRGTVSVASQFKLVAIYETIVGPQK